MKMEQECPIHRKNKCLNSRWIEEVAMTYSLVFKSKKFVEEWREKKILGKREEKAHCKFHKNVFISPFLTHTTHTHKRHIYIYSIEFVYIHVVCVACECGHARWKH